MFECEFDEEAVALAGTFGSVDAELLEIVVEEDVFIVEPDVVVDVMFGLDSVVESANSGRR